MSNYVLGRANDGSPKLPSYDPIPFHQPIGIFPVHTHTAPISHISSAQNFNNDFSIWLFVRHL